MFYLARSAPASTGRKALSSGAAAGLSVLALLGVYELAAGRVGPGILVSVLVESILAFMYILLFFAERGRVIKSERAEVEQT